VTAVFADTLYWIAVVHPTDPWRDPALRARKVLGQIQLVTTDTVLNETLAALGRTRHLRELAAAMVWTILADPNTIVVHQTRDLFLEGLRLYEARPDKSYSLTDCISMNLMRSMGLKDILTNDSHFSQEGFNVLILRDRT
jgi:predicted nucleic acid-binding protein